MVAIWFVKRVVKMVQSMMHTQEPARLARTYTETVKHAQMTSRDVNLVVWGTT